MTSISSLLLHSAVGYTAPGVLASLVDEKRREVDRMRKLPEAREDGPWQLRLNYAAEDSCLELGRAIGWKPERPVVLADLKRTSPIGRLGKTVSVASSLDVKDALVRVHKLGVVGALISTDLASYGGGYRDLREACQFAREGLRSTTGGGDAFPIIAKDLIVDPLQIGRAACEGARAIHLVAAAMLPDLPALLDTCTLLGLETIVEVHTLDEVSIRARAWIALSDVCDGSMCARWLMHNADGRRGLTDAGDGRQRVRGRNSACERT